MYYQKILIFFIVTILLTISPHLPLISSTYIDSRYADCAPVKSLCGFKQQIKYPFWESNIVSPYCGHPSFKLKCDENSTLTINIEDQNYKILDIDYNAKVFTISKPELVHDACPDASLLTNTTLDNNIFNLTSESQNAILFYDCNLLQFSKDKTYAFSCNINSYNSPFKSSVGYMTVSETSEQVLRKNCSFEINVPILRTQADDLASGTTNIDNALSAGFKVNWMIDADGQCKDCTKSGGRCGYNLSIDRPTCFCQDGPHDRVCGLSNNETSYSSIDAATPKRSVPNYEIVVGVGIGIAICLLCSIMCFFMYWRNHKKDTSTEFPTHKKSYSRRSTGGSTFAILNGSTYFGVHVFNYRELEEATDYFNPSKELGEGGFGTVYHGKLRDGREVAIKRLYENNSKRAEQFLNEVEILANLRHDNLVNLYGCTARHSRELLLVYEYVPNGTVADRLHGKQSKLEPLPWSTRLSIATETASALVYLHESDIVHRDVKTQNILLGNDFSVKVADFGLSRLFPLDATHVSTAPQGTPGYVDPEYHQCYQLTEKSDVYSFGVMLAELISSLPAVDVTRKRNEINLSNMAITKIQDGDLHEFVDASLGYESDFMVNKEITAVADLALQCLESTKEMRPSMSDVFKTLLAIQNEQGSDVDSAEVVDIPADDVLMLKGDFSPTSPQREDYLGIRYYKPNASV